MYECMSGVCETHAHTGTRTHTHGWTHSIEGRSVVKAPLMVEQHKQININKHHKQIITHYQNSVSCMSHRLLLPQTVRWRGNGTVSESSVSSVPLC
jgi:hypothetical protein